MSDWFRKQTKQNKQKIKRHTDCRGAYTRTGNNNLDVLAIVLNRVKQVHNRRPHATTG